MVKKIKFKEIILESGFKEVYESFKGGSKCEKFKGKSESGYVYDGTRSHMSLYIEAIK